MPIPGLVTVSPRLAASVGAAVAGGLLLLLWTYRRRGFILLWAIAWAGVAAALFLASDGDPDRAVSTMRLAVAGFAAVASAELFLAGLLGHSNRTAWPVILIVFFVTGAVYAAAAGLLPAPALYAATFFTISITLAASAWRVMAIARDRHAVGGFIMAGAFTVVVVCNAAAAAAALLFAINLTGARLILLANGGAYVLVAFAQHLFVFEDMLFDLRDSKRDLLNARTELRHAAITDPLTGMYNRRFFDEVAAHQIEHHRRFHLPLSLVYVDVDRFKEINDTRGHDFGDRVLVHVATYLNRHTREADYLFRHGGDEFLILMSCTEDEARRRAQDLQAQFPSTLDQAGLPSTLSLSIGVALVPAGARDLQETIQLADGRMYDDKRRKPAFTIGALTLAILPFCIAAIPAMAFAQSRPLVHPSAAAIYARLLPQIERIRLFDHHAHPAFPDDADVDIAPPPPGGSPLRLREDNPETSAAARALFGFPFADMKGTHAKWLADKKAALKRQHPGAAYFNDILDRLGIETSMANRVAMAPYLDPARFKWVFFVDCFMFPFDNSALAARNGDEAVYMPLQTKLRQQYQQALGLTSLPPTFADYLSLVSRSLEANQKRGGVAVKFEASYFRSLFFADPTRDRVGSIYDQYRSGGVPSFDEYTAFQDFIFRHIVTEAGRLHLPVHIHTSVGGGDYFNIRGVNVLNLENVLRDPRYSATTFVLIHGGYPFDRQAILLTWMKNVYLDSSATELMLYPTEFKNVLRQWLETFPEKVTFGTDAFPYNDALGVEEVYWIGVQTSRTALAAALAEMVAAREITESRAMAIARGYLHDNAAALYK
jgi:uncharacterized protein